MFNVSWLGRLILSSLLLSSLTKASAQQYTSQKIDSVISKSYYIVDRNESLKTSSNALKASQKIGYYAGEAKALKAIINCYLGLGNQEKALSNAEQLLKIAKKQNDYFHITQVLIAKTLIYSYLGFFEKAYEISIEAENICKHISNQDEYYICMGQIYSGRSEIQNQQFANTKNTLKLDQQSVNFYKKIKDPKKRDAWLSIQYASLGYTYIDLSDYNSALYYNHKSYQLAKADQDSINQGFALFGLANTYLEMNRTDSSVHYYKKALPIFEKAKDIYRMQYIYQDLANIYEKLGEDKIYSYYSKKAVELSDLIRINEKTEMDKVSNDIIQQEKDSWYENLYITIACLTVAAILITWAGLKYFNKHHPKKTETDNKTEDNFTIDKQEQYQLELKLNDGFAELIELARDNNPAFLSRFREVYPLFFTRLCNTYPDLTTGQLTFCALLKLNFSTKEIASCTNISVRSVETKKNRMRKQLSIPSDVDLNKWMMAF